MELILEISDEKLKDLDIHDTRITFEELQSKVAFEKEKLKLLQHRIDSNATIEDEDAENEISNMVRDEQRSFYKAD